MANERHGRPSPNDPVTLTNPRLPGRSVTVPRTSARSLRRHGWVDVEPDEPNVPDRAALFAAAAELDLVVDKRWSTTRVQRAIDEAVSATIADTE